MPTFLREVNFFLLRPSADLMVSTHIMEGNLLFPQSTDLNIKLTLKKAFTLWRFLIKSFLFSLMSHTLSLQGRQRIVLASCRNVLSSTNPQARLLVHLPEYIISYSFFTVRLYKKVTT